MPTTYLTFSELARRANVPPSALVRMMRAGQLAPDAVIESTGAQLFSESRLPELIRAIGAQPSRQ